VVYVCYVCVCVWCVCVVCVVCVWCMCVVLGFLIEIKGDAACVWSRSVIVRGH